MMAFNEMTKIDRYLLLLYFRVLSICFATVSGMLIVIHIFTNLDEFLRYGSNSGSGIATILIEYYGPYTLWIFERLSGMMALLALLFVVAWIQKTHEFAALQASGITKRRVLRPLLIASAVVILAAAGMREWVIPRFQDRLDRNPQELAGDVSIRPTFDFDAVALFRGAALRPAGQEIVLPNLLIQGEPLASRIGSRLAAATATYRGASATLPAGYLFQGVTVPANIDGIDSVVAVDGVPLLLTPKDAPWVPSGSCFLVSGVEFDTLRGGRSRMQFGSTAELIAFLRDMRGGGNGVRVQIHQRLLRPAADWTMVLLGIPLLLSRPERHIFRVAGACTGVVGGFTAAVIGLSALGSSGAVLSPAFACWLPLLIFFPWGWAKSAAAMET